MQSLIVEQISTIFKKEMKLTIVEPDDNFFDLGGDSLMAENIILTLQKQFKVDIETAVLLSASSPNQLATLIKEIKQNE